MTDIIKSLKEDLWKSIRLTSRYRKENEKIAIELTRLLNNIAPACIPESDLEGVYWQVDNAVCGLLEKPKKGK